MKRRAGSDSTGRREIRHRRRNDSPRKDLDWLTRYGESLGLAFQITDAILDADEVSNGNSKHKGMANYLSVTGLARTKERVKNLLTACLRGNATLRELSGGSARNCPVRGSKNGITNSFQQPVK